MGTVSQLKRDNILRILQILFGNFGGSTRPELALQSGLTTTTVQTIIGSLMEASVVKEEGPAVSIGGRKAQRFAINPDYRRLVGVYLRVNKVLIGLFDYTVKPIETETHAVQLDSASVELTVQQVAEWIRALLARHGLTAVDVAGIGFSVPGPVNFLKGRVNMLRGYPHWKNIALKERMENLLGIPTYVDKDVNSGIGYLKMTQVHKPDANIMYIALEGGIGSSILIGGNIYRSKRGVAGEIGHLTIAGNDRLCACGNVGCLETVASDFAILSKVRAAKRIEPDAPLEMKDVIRLANEGDPQVNAILKGVVADLATMIRETVLMYDPDEIYINCQWMRGVRSYFIELLGSLQLSTTLIVENDLRVFLIDEPSFGLKSAAAIVATQEMESPESSILKEPLAP